MVIDVAKRPLAMEKRTPNRLMALNTYMAVCMLFMKPSTVSLLTGWAPKKKDKITAMIVALASMPVPRMVAIILDALPI